MQPTPTDPHPSPSPQPRRPLTSDQWLFRFQLYGSLGILAFVGLGALSLICLCAVGAAITSVFDARWEDMARPFNEDIDRFAEIADLQHATHAESSVGFRRGKVLLVDMEKYEISRWQAFSDPVFARTPEEVGTVVQLNFDFSDVGEYEDGTIALEQQLDAVVIDLRAGKIVGHLHVSAPPCPEVINHAGRAKSYVEGREVVRAVHSLPVRPD